MAKGQKRSGREPKKPKADKTTLAPKSTFLKPGPVASPAKPAAK